MNSFLFGTGFTSQHDRDENQKVNVLRPPKFAAAETEPLMVISRDETMVLVTGGRLLLGGLFIIGGIGHLFALPTIAAQMRERTVPFPVLALSAGTAFEITAGMALMFGLFVPLAAFGLILFTIASSVMMMNFWNMTGEKRMSAIDGWVSNFGVIGGLLIVAALALDKTACCSGSPF